MSVTGSSLAVMMVLGLSQRKHIPCGDIQVASVMPFTGG